MDKLQNILIELQALDAANGGSYEWTKTPIETTDSARRTDPLSGAYLGDGWWQPPSETRPRAVAKPKPASRKRTVANDAAKYDAYLPADNEDAYQWRGDLAIKIDVTRGARQSFFEALGAYIAKFGPNAKGKDLNRGAIRNFVRLICEA